MSSIIHVSSSRSLLRGSALAAMIALSAPSTAATVSGEVDAAFGVNGYQERSHAAPTVSDSFSLVEGVGGIQYVQGLARESTAPQDRYDSFLSHLTPNGEIDTRGARNSFGEIVITDEFDRNFELVGVVTGPNGQRYAAFNVHSDTVKGHIIQVNQDGSSASANTGLGGDLDGAYCIIDTGRGIVALGNGGIDRADPSFDQLTKIAKVSYDLDSDVNGTINSRGQSWITVYGGVGLSDGRFGILVSEADNLLEDTTEETLAYVIQTDDEIDTRFGANGVIDAQPVQLGDETYTTEFITSDLQGRLYVVRSNGPQGVSPTPTTGHITRYRRNGSLDTSWASQGVLLTEMANDAAIMAFGNGRLAIPHHFYGSGGRNYVVSIYDESGQPDTGGLNGGQVSLTLALDQPNERHLGAHLMSVDGQGGFLFGGYKFDDANGGTTADWLVRTAPLIDLSVDDIEFSSPTVDPGTPATSSSIVISGLHDGVSAYAKMTDGSVSVNGGEFSEDAQLVANGDELRVRHIASSSPTTSKTTRLRIGGTPYTATGVQTRSNEFVSHANGDSESALARADEFAFTSLTTDIDTEIDSISFAPLTGVAGGQEVTSNIQTISGINSTATVTVSNGSLEVNGQRVGTTSQLDNGDTIRLVTTAPTQPMTQKLVTANISGVVVQWSVTSGATNPSGDGGGSGPLNPLTLVLGALALLASRRR